MNHIINIITNYIILILMLFVISCSDDFKTAIKSENETAGTNINTGNPTDDNWIKIGNVATPRAGAAVALEGDWLYIYGGETYSDEALDDFWRYNLSTGDYEILVSNGERAYATLVNLNGMLYRFGGKDTAGTVYDDQVDGFYYYDTSTITWNYFNAADTTASWPVERSHHIAVPVYNAAGSVESIYFNGGKDSTNDNVGGTMFEIDLSTYKYKWYEYSISHVRSEHSAVFYNDYIYLFGGYNSETYHNDIQRFDTLNPTDPLEEITITGTTIIPARSGISMIEHDGRFYVFGGFDGTDCLDDLWYYSSGSWTKISTAPFKRAFYSAVKYNNSLIIFGGYSFNSSSQKVYSSEIWQYNLD